MTATAQMLRAHPGDLGGVDVDALAACIDACFSCAQICTACADACLGEEMIDELRRCIRTDLDCADICATTGTVLSRHTGYDADLTRALVQACAVACRTCGEECASHADMHEHCRICAEACRTCADACETLLDRLG